MMNPSRAGVVEKLERFVGGMWGRMSGDAGNATRGAHVLEALEARQMMSVAMPFNDPLLPSQWYLVGENANANINVLPVWPHFTGKGVTIAVVDEGMEYTNKDIGPQYVPGLSHDFVDADNDPRPEKIGEGHATSVGTIAAGAANNGYGTVGAAPGASIASIRFLGVSALGFDSGTAITFGLDHVDVYNHSWGRGDNWLDLSRFVAGEPEAIQRAITEGRGGLGAVLVMSAGNDGDSGENTNYSAWTADRRIIVVSATTSTGVYGDYSAKGASVFVSAPGGMGGSGGISFPADDISGLRGYSFTDLSDDNNHGTSYSAPLVSGVVALMLEANADLTWRDVKHILADSARKIDAQSDSWQINGAGRAFSEELGFGMVDAAAAVELALGWKNVGAEVMKTSGLLESGAVVPDGGVLEVTYAAGAGLKLENVQSLVDIKTWNRGELEVSLISPSGTVAKLAVAHEDANADFQAWESGANTFWDEDTGGTWTLRITDTKEDGKTATLNHWGMEFYGTDGKGETVEISGTPAGEAETEDEVIVIGPMRVTMEFSQGKPLTYTNSEGNKVTLTMSGPGVGLALFADESIAEVMRVTLKGTTMGSSLTVSAGASGASVGKIVVEGAIGNINGRTLDVTESVEIQGAAGNVSLRNLVGEGQRHISIGGSAASRVNLNLGRVADLSLESTSSLGNVSVVQWLDLNDTKDTVTYGGLGTLNVTGSKGVTGDFAAWLVSEQAKAKPVAWVRVAGSAAGTWDFGGSNVGSITVGGTFNGTITDAGVVGAIRGGTFDKAAISVVNVGSVYGKEWNKSRLDVEGRLGAFTAVMVNGMRVEAGVAIGGVVVNKYLEDAEVSVAGAEEEGGNAVIVYVKAPTVGAVRLGTKLGGTLVADRLGSLVATGVKALIINAGIAGAIAISGKAEDVSFDIDRIGTLSTGGLSGKVLSHAIGSVVVRNATRSGVFGGTIILGDTGVKGTLGSLVADRVINADLQSTGNVGSITVGSVADSMIRVGMYISDHKMAPATLESFVNPKAVLGSFIVTGASDPAGVPTFERSGLAAAVVGRVFLRAIDDANTARHGVFVGARVGVYRRLAADGRIASLVVGKSLPGIYDRGAEGSGYVLQVMPVEATL
jgi:subtilisin family serine protease